MKNTSSINRYKSLLIVAGLALWACNCSRTSGNDSNGDEGTIIKLSHYMVPCTGAGLQWCLVYKEGKEKDWKYSYTNVQGLDYEWGYNYELEVDVIKEKSPPIDDPGGYFQLKKIISKEKENASTLFELVIGAPGEERALSKDGEKLEIMGVQVITDLSDEILAPIFEGAEGTFVGEFQHTDQTNEIKLLNLKTE